MTRTYTPRPMTLSAWEKNQAAVAYGQFLQTTDKPWCWACGRGGGYADKPEGWFGPWLIERAHIASKTRALDVRAVCLLCSLCHKTSHGERIVLAGQRWPLPRLERAHLLWLKY